MTVVLDASAIVAHLLSRPEGRAVGRLVRDSRELAWTLPLVDAEVGHALRGLVLRDEEDPVRARHALTRFRSLPLVRTGHTSLMEAAWQLRHNLSFYDALYVALAAKIDAPLVTLDGRLAEAPGLPVEIIVP